ncbi:peptide-methionine (S)-S-oxide reductase MsrA [Psychrobium sp. MM17-31]|uniref:peptide-methionine (S)-S-oxide reductase MsrA n=1 Tax=Psychrobium sp. MM17-31 TaxID=2917758 RepID=UPI001EF44BF0|nr:peptide-methionine (S)-S-oxide reductase MsrA [Psychrobium sp. MM17-31]MCG7531815.1 peptide-methionine (S)-S-oxide reductase MsrA [Psychrobium sp. MM17-31]
MQTATFGGGCFWGVEALFREQDGVIEAFSGYEGGDKENPTYKEVCTGTTGHAEVVEVTFDESKISYQQLLNIFFENHNPTELNRQGVDVGTQYRSAVFYHDATQQQLANETIARLTEEKRFGDKKIVTEVTPASTFFKAEEYHQQYFAKNGGSCSI